MKTFLVVTERPDDFVKLADRIASNKTHAIRWAGSVESARRAASSRIDLIIIDESMEGRPGLDIAKEMIRINAMAHLVLVSTLSPDEFHEASEGLGVLTSLPQHPDEKDTERLLKALTALD